ncbi:MAG: DMT family transporter [Pseudomonadales bacterium]
MHKPKPPNTYRRGVVLAVVAGIILSTLGIGVRLLEQASGMQIIFYRAIGLLLFMSTVVIIRNRGISASKLLESGWLGFGASLAYTGASIAIIYALLNTTVANTMFVVSLAPLFAALAGWIFLREAVPLRTWVALVLAITGVLIMVNGGLSAQGLIGIGFALCMAVCYGSFSVCLRAGRDVDMLPPVCFSALLLGIIGWWYADSLHLPTQDIILCLAMGAFQLGLGSLLLTMAAQSVPAAQITLLAMLEVVLNPVWVWLGVGEVPAPYTLVGGALIIGAIIYQAIDRKPRATSQS